MSDEAPGEDKARLARLERALLAHVRQEFSAPAAAIVDYARMLSADAGSFGLDGMQEDLGRIRAAGEKLNEQIAGLLDPAQFAEQIGGGDPDAFRTRLRHDLRTPITAIKGYGEMLAEDARAEGLEGFAKDLDRLLDAANRMLRQIDALAEAGTPGAGTAEAVAGAEQLIAATLDAIAPVDENAVAREIEPSAILVIDDNESNRDLLSRRLTREGHTVMTAESGEKGLEALERSGADLILLDLVMPGISGFEVLRRLKQSPTLCQVPVIMISAVDEIDSIVRCIEMGAEDYLLKPFNPVLLQARINASLEKHQLRKREQSAVHDLEAERAKSEKLLLHILPSKIAARLKTGEDLIADKFLDVTVLFADLVGFTPLSTRLQPRQLVDLLNRIFSSFDELALQLGLEKIKTIGDCYMAAAGLPEARPDHAKLAADMALGMVKTLAAINATAGEKLQLRIGLHSGPVVAGVIGTHKFVYDVWGDAVNTASRMESHGQADMIHVSPMTFRLLRNDYQFAPRGPVEIKGKGMMETYFLRGPRPAKPGA